MLFLKLLFRPVLWLVVHRLGILSIRDPDIHLPPPPNIDKYRPNESAYVCVHGSIHRRA